MRGTTLEVAMLANVIGAYSAISSVNICVTGPLESDISFHHSLWMNLTLIGQQNINGAALEYRRFVLDYELKGKKTEKQ